MREDLPAGTVTFLFTDVEGSTRLLHELGAERYAEALAEHRRRLREAFARYGGLEVDTQGDAFFYAFATADGALSAAGDAQASLADGPIQVRMGLHTGTPLLTAEGYVGPDVHRAARIAAAGHGGQVLLSAATATLVGTAGLQDLGEHRLKDLSAPERIFQAGRGQFAPLKTLYQTNLPVPVTSFLGRERELAELSGLIARDDIRLVTLTGPGGTGKTRLAVAAAGASAELFSDGVWWVPLTPLRDPALVLSTAAGVLGASGELAEHIGDKRLLLLFDNFEQVVPAAAGVGALLTRCPNLRALITSRELLGLPGEQAYPVPPLAAAEGVELFLTRALAARPDFRGNGIVGELCRRLDNLPLAIELAAARVRMLSPEQLLERLGQRLDLLKGGRGVDERQQTLRATIEWSHDLLTDDERQLFARLAVFRGGWTLEAAEQIVDADLDVLQSLVDKSLVRVLDERFTILETIRQFAAERLDALGVGDEVRRRHAEFYTELVEQAEAEIHGPEQGQWWDRLTGEIDNFRAALEWSTSGPTPEVALRLAGLLWRYWWIRGMYLEGRRWAEAALKVGAAAPPAVRVGAVYTLANMALGMGSNDEATRLLEECLSIYREQGDSTREANVMTDLGIAFMNERMPEAAHRYFQQALVMARTGGDTHREGVSLLNLASTSTTLGNLDEAAALQQQALRLVADDEQTLGNLLGGMADVQRRMGNLALAVEYARRSTVLSARTDDRWTLAHHLIVVADLMARLGRPDTAATVLGRQSMLRDEMAIAISPEETALYEELAQTLPAQLGEDAFRAAFERGRSLDHFEAVEVAVRALDDGTRRADD